MITSRTNSDTYIPIEFTSDCLHQSLVFLSHRGIIVISEDSVTLRFTPAPPNVSYVVLRNLSPAGPIPLPVSGGGHASEITTTPRMLNKTNDDINMDQQVIASRLSDVFIFGGSRVSLDGMATLGHVRGGPAAKSWEG